MKYWFGIGLSLALFSSSPANADRFHVDLPPPLDARAATFSTPTQPVSLARVVADLKVGDIWAEAGAGLICLIQQQIQWKAANDDLSALGLDRTFRDTAAEVGLRVSGDRTNLFEEESKSSDLQIGALIRNIHAKICLPLTDFGSADGVIAMEIEWQVYSVSRGAIIARIATQGGLEMKAPEKGALPLIVAGAFADNIRRLAADERFRAVVTGSPGPIADSPPRAADITLALPAAVKPTPLKIAAQGVALISSGDAFGSGVLISSDGFLLTNHHVVGDSDRVRVRWSDGTEVVGQVVRSDKRRDVALIKTPSPKAQALSIRHTPVELGETVYAIGTPLEKELAGTLTRGAVSTVDRKVNGQIFIQSDVAVTHGNSGGPLLDEKGWIVGLSDLGYAPGGISQNINFFIPIDEALKALALKPAG